MSANSQRLVLFVLVAALTDYTHTLLLEPYYHGQLHLSVHHH
jgi:hypothetical protein